MTLTGQVVVRVIPQFRNHESGGCVGRYRELGIYAHGKNRGEAVRHLKEQVRVLIQFHRERGNLEAMLNDTGMKWWTVAEARRLGIAYEDLLQGIDYWPSPLSAPTPSLQASTVAPAIPATNYWHQDLAAAA